MKKRLRHVIVFATLKPFFRFFIYLRFRFRAKRFKPPKGVKGPYLIISNHAMAIDPFLVSLSFKEPIYYIASDMIFSIPFVSPIIKYLVQPIPKTKYRSDMDTVKDTIKVIKSGGSVGLFPEGNATFHGELMDVPFAVAKLIRLLKVPVLFYHIRGGYQTKPRWAKSRRVGKVHGEVNHLWTVEDYQHLKVDEIYQKLIENLDIKNFKTQASSLVKYKSNERAMDIESAYYICPECKAMHTIYSDKNIVACTACDFKVEYTKEGFMKPLSNTKYFKTTYEWYGFQEKALYDYIKNCKNSALIFEDNNENVLKVLRARKKLPLGKANLKLYKDRLEMHFKDTVESWPINVIQSAVQQKNKLILYHRKEEKTYYFLSHPKRNALKYVLAIEKLNSKEAL